MAHKRVSTATADDIQSHRCLRLELSGEEHAALEQVTRLLRLLNRRTGDDDYGELADAIDLKMWGPVVLVSEGEQ